MAADFSIHIPSKTYLLGEYSVLDNEPALIISTEPHFCLRATLEKNKNTNPFHNQSDAGKLYTAFSDICSQYKIEFSDPHHNRGGFGGSGAEFIGIYTLIQKHLNKSGFDLGDKTYLKGLHHTFKELSKTKEGRNPSGVDILGQCLGDISFVNQTLDFNQTHPWPFESLTLFILKTPSNLKTHDHLQTLNINQFTELGSLSRLGHKALVDNNKSDFIDCINQAHLSLARLGLCCDSTQNLLEKLQAERIVLGAKGCGAMGADVIMALVNKKNRLEFEQLILNLDLILFATEEKRTGGAYFDISLETHVSEV